MIWLIRIEDCIHVDVVAGGNSPGDGIEHYGVYKCTVREIVLCWGKRKQHKTTIGVQRKAQETYRRWQSYIDGHMWQSQEKSSKVKVWLTSEYKGSEDNMWAGEFSKRWTDKKIE